MSNFSNPVLEIALAMQKELDNNSHKMGWALCDLNWLLERAEEEIKELRQAVKKNKSIKRVISECADVANFMMMFADNYEQKPRTPKNE